MTKQNQIDLQKNYISTFLKKKKEMQFPVLNNKETKQLLEYLYDVYTSL